MKIRIIILLCFLLTSLCACGEAAPETTSTIQTTTEVPTTTISKETTKAPSTTNKDPYYSVYKENSDKYPGAMNDLYYFLYDVDSNKTEELFLGVETHLGIVINSVYTIKDGVTVRQEALPGWMWEFPQRRSLFKNGTIRINGESWSGSGYGYLRFEDSELKHKGGVLIEHDEYFRSYGNGGENVPITKEEFDRVRKEYEGDGQVVELNWKPLAEYGR